MASPHVNLIYSFTESIAQSSCYKKIVRLVSDDFCLAGLNKSGEIVYLQHYDFGSEALSMSEKVQAIKDVCDKAEFHADEEVFAYQAFANTQVPMHLYSAKVEEAGMRMLVPQVEDYTMVHQNVMEYNITNIAAWPKELWQAVNEYFPTAGKQSQAEALIRKLYEQRQNVLIYITNNTISILAKSKYQFLGMNTFAFTQVEDCCYYCMAFLRKMYENMSQVEPVLCGNYVSTSPVYELLKRYLPHLTDGELSGSIEHSYRYYDITSY